MKWKFIPEEINGFKILKDFGRTKRKGRYGIVICKECKREFQTSLYSLHVIKSCGCIKYSAIKPLPEFINGFRIIKDLGSIKDKRLAIVECKICKKEYEVNPHVLKDRNSCGCIRNGIINAKYSKSHPRLLMIYKHMKGRCYNKNNQDYYNYGEREIKICDEWLNDRNKFYEWAIKMGYQNNLSIDRIDNSKGYYPENCKWSNAEEQGRNTRRNVLTMGLAREIRSFKSTMTYRELSEKYSVSNGTIAAVLSNSIWRE